jgi:catechol 2,3-dioxygenase-like lactoylglutathione lyase family enzyme
MNTTSMTAVKFSVEVITLPVSNVEQALRFYVDRVGFALDVDYSPNDALRVVQLTPPGSSCSIQIGRGLTGAPAGSVRNVYLVVSDLEAARSRLLERGVKVGDIRHKVPIDAWDGSFAPGLDPARGDYASFADFSDPMATAGCYRNGVTAICDVLWKLRNVDHARRSRSALGEAGTLFPRALSITSRAKEVPCRSHLPECGCRWHRSICYREAGPKDAPTILQLHGFPTAGRLFRDVIRTQPMFGMAALRQKQSFAAPLLWNVLELAKSVKAAPNIGKRPHHELGSTNPSLQF